MALEVEIEIWYDQTCEMKIEVRSVGRKGRSQTTVSALSMCCRNGPDPWTQSSTCACSKTGKPSRDGSGCQIRGMVLGGMGRNMVRTRRPCDQKPIRRNLEVLVT